MKSAFDMIMDNLRHHPSDWTIDHRIVTNKKLEISLRIHDFFSYGPYRESNFSKNSAILDNFSLIQKFKFSRALKRLRRVKLETKIATLVANRILEGGKESVGFADGEINGSTLQN